jgi:hypothetical protein
MDTLLRLLIEGSTAHLTIDAQQVGCPIGNPPIFVLDLVCQGLVSICYLTP